jgi:polyhydroxyalkanoate synthesis regulator phasin
MALVVACITVALVAVLVLIVRQPSRGVVAVPVVAKDGEGMIREEYDRLAGELEVAGKRILALEGQQVSLQRSNDEGREAYEEEHKRRLRENVKTELEHEITKAEVTRLTAEIDRLKKQVHVIRKTNEGLTERLNRLTSVAGVSVVPAALKRAPGDLASRVMRDVRVVKVDKALEYVALDVGSLHGVMPGMYFSVMDGDRPIAQLRALDVREDVTGASVDELLNGRFPGVNDRAILRKQTL